MADFPENEPMEYSDAGTTKAAVEIRSVTKKFKTMYEEKEFTALDGVSLSVLQGEFLVIAGANGFSRIANLTEEELEYFTREFATLDNFDIILIDTGAGISNNVLQFVEAADEIIIVTTPEPTAITDAYGIIKIITTELALEAELKLKLLVNRVHSAEEGKRVSDRIINIAGQFLNYKLEYLGFVYDDSAVTTSVIRQKPFLEAMPSSKPAICIKHIVGRIEKTEIVPKGGVIDFLKKFISK